MRLRIILCILVATCHLTAFGKIDTSLSRNPAYLGETVVLRLYEAAGIPHDPAAPIDGVTWLTPDGERADEDLIFAFRPTRTGTVALGSLVFRYADGATEVLTLPSLTVLDNGIGDDVALEFRTPLVNAMVGQAVPASVRLLVSPKLTLTEDRRLPVAQVDDAIWRHRTTNTDDRRFHLTTGDTTVGGKPYRFWRYDGVLFPQAVGELEGYATFEVNVVLTPKRRPNEFMENLMPSERRLVTVERRVRLSAVKTVAPPASPDGMHDVGLVGEFKTTLSARPTVVPLDGDTTIRFTARGDGNLELCKTPLLALNGWRCFNPQKRVDLKAGTVTLEWILQPTGHAFAIEDLAVGHYSPESRRWVSTPLTDAVVVEGGKGTGKPPLPLVHDDGRTFTGGLPLIGLILAWAIGPLVAVIVLTLVAWRKPLRIRRFDRRRRRLIAALAKADANTAADLLSGDLLIALRELCGVPPGTSFREFKEQLSDDAFAQRVEAALEASYKPEPDTGLGTALIDGLKRFRPPLIALFLVLLTVGRAEESPEAAYARYDFAEAAKGFETRLATKATVGTMLNLGHCRYLNQEYAAALLCAERCLRVEPRHPLARELRRNCLEKLDLLSIGQADAPRVSPLEIAWIGAAIWSIGWLAFVSLGWIQSRRLLAIGMVLVACGLLAGVAAGIQWRRGWRSNQMLVVQETPIHAIAAADEPTDRALAVGSTVTLLEEVDGWARVQAGNDIGWVPRTAVGRLVPTTGTSTFTTY